MSKTWPTQEELDEQWEEEQESYREWLQEHYCIPGNKKIAEMIGKYDLTYSQARRLVMFEEKLTMSEIADLEGISKAAVQASIDLARKKIAAQG